MIRFSMITLVLLLGTHSMAQDPHEIRIGETVQGFFKAMELQDSVMLKEVLRSDAVFFTTYDSPIGPQMRRESAQNFITAVGTPHKEIWQEVIMDLDIKQSENLGYAWMRYNFFLDGKLIHCGVNAMQLFFDGTHWMIFEIADTRTKEGCMQKD